MKRFRGAATALLLSVSLSSGIGLQHGLFRSQSTQGTQWTGTATITSEKYRITVFPDYLDVELDWTFTAGGTEPDSFKNALEIVGNINLEDNSTVISMLVWYKDMILKGKLKENATARDEYETVVERDAEAPPPPRDPVLLEMVRDDNYDISIFPVEFGGERRVRIRYLIPGKTVDGEVMMGYPHAFTDSASVEIRCGTGVSNYSIVTSQTIRPIYYNTDFAQLPADEYSFKAHSSIRTLPGITYIVPEVKNSSTASRFYVSSFSTADFSGSVVHASFPSARNMLLTTAEKEDFVVLWRWNSTDVLHAYTRQIVAQADALIGFFNALNASSKRGALVISVLDGETVRFGLDAPGGTTYLAMLEYLRNLAELPVPELPDNSAEKVTTLTDDKMKTLAETAVEEFKTALASALAMFSETNEATRKLLFLSTGPQGYTSYDTFTPEISINVDFIPFSSVFSSTSGDFLSSVYSQRWPGVRLPLQSLADTTHKLFGYITNGMDTDSFEVAATSGYYMPAGLFDRHIYSDRTVEQSITWKLFKNDTVVQEITETPGIIPIEDGLQHARSICPLKCMVPLAPLMPSSLASTLGFIDMKYTLLALEEDALDQSVAAQYADTGVPLLAHGEIYQAPDEKASIPVMDWLEANPREFPRLYYYNGMLIFDDMDFAGRAGGLETTRTTSAPGAAAANWGNPQAEVINAPTSPATSDDYEIVPVKQMRLQKPANAAIRISNGLLTIPASLVKQEDMAAMIIAIYDISGRVIARLDMRDLISGSVLRYRLPDLRPGIYCIRIEHASFKWAKSVLIR